MDSPPLDSDLEPDVKAGDAGAIRAGRVVVRRRRPLPLRGAWSRRGALLGLAAIVAAAVAGAPVALGATGRVGAADLPIIEKAAISPDGATLAIASLRGTTWSITLVTLAGGERRVVYQGHWPLEDVGFSADGRYLSFVKDGPHANGRLAIVRVSSGAVHWVRQSSEQAQAPWAPAKPVIAFFTDCHVQPPPGVTANVSGCIATFNAATGRIRVVLKTCALCGDPQGGLAWTPNGRQLVFGQAGNTTRTGGSTPPTLSLVSLAGHRALIRKCRGRDCYAFDVEVAPNGKAIAVNYSPAIVALPISGETSKQLGAWPNHEVGGDVGWTADSSALVYHGPSGVVFAPINGAHPTVVADPEVPEDFSEPITWIGPHELFEWTSTGVFELNTQTASVAELFHF